MRAQLIDAVEILFFQRNDWRVAQHAALLHLDRFQPFTDQVDVVKALCFADHACRLSKDDPRARIAMGYVSWERRLPLGILHDVKVVRTGEARLRAELDGRHVEMLLAEASLLEGLARAYLADVDGAHKALVEADQFGRLTIEAVIQLFVAAGTEFPEASEWAANRLPPGMILPGRAEHLQRYTQRRKFLRLLHTRGSNVRG